MHAIRQRRARAAVLLTTTMLLTMALAAPATAAISASGTHGGSAATALAAPSPCADIMPIDEVETGMVGRGWTVVQGDTPERFKVEVLGILPDVIAPGRDLIIVEVSDVPDSTFISRAGGIWAGMSGSPVYVNGRLIGAVAYGFSFGPSGIGGLTPAQDMLRVLDYGTAAGAALAEREAGTVAVPRELRAELAERAGVPQAEAGSLSRLPLPMAVSGLSSRARQRLQDGFDRAGTSVMVMSGSSAASPSGGVSLGTPVPGGNFAGVISYGDLTAAGIGTTTYVCDGQALAFGHPLLFSGRTSLGANDANALAVVDDPTFGPYKLAAVGELFGTLDQDRLAGIRAELGVAPTTIPVTSDVRSLDHGSQRHGRTDVADSRFVPDIAAFHLLGNLDAVGDRIGGGSSRLKWVVRGERADGDPFILRRANRYASQGDITFESIFELFEQLATIEANPFEKITFTDVDLEAALTEDYQAYSISAVKVSKNGGAFRPRESLRARPGDELVVRAILRQYRGERLRVDLPLTVPDSAIGEGFLEVTGGSGSDFFGLDGGCLFDHQACSAGGGGGDGFDALLQSLKSAPKNHDLSAELVLFGFEGEAEPIASTRERLDRVVDGSASIFISIEP